MVADRDTAGFHQGSAGIDANLFFTKTLGMTGQVIQGRATEPVFHEGSLRSTFQTNSAIDRRNVQAVFVWRYLPPFGTLQLAFQRGTAAFGERSQQGNTLFIKATTVF